MKFTTIMDKRYEHVGLRLVKSLVIKNSLKELEFKIKTLTSGLEIKTKAVMSALESKTDN